MVKHIFLHIVFAKEMWIILLYSRNSGVRMFGLDFLNKVVRPFVCKINNFSFFIDCRVVGFLFWLHWRNFGMIISVSSFSQGSYLLYAKLPIIRLCWLSVIGFDNRSPLPVLHNWRLLICVVFRVSVPHWLLVEIKRWLQLLYSITPIF